MFYPKIQPRLGNYSKITDCPHSSQISQSARLLTPHAGQSQMPSFTSTRGFPLLRFLLTPKGNEGWGKFHLGQVSPLYQIHT